MTALSAAGTPRSAARTALFYDRPVHFTRGEGVYLYDGDGNAYLDAYNNVPAVGHCHPRVAEAIARQAATLNVHTRYLTDGVVDYAERLLATHGEPGAGRALDRVMFTCTGSEANDLALRVARHYAGGTGVIVTANAYHGVTAAVAEASPSLGPNVPVGPHIRVVPAPGPDFSVHVAAAIADLRNHGFGLAAFLADSLFSSDGVIPARLASCGPVQDMVHQAGGLYIADEVQSGFGRTGSHFWGYQRHGLTPDIVTMGKPMGNGLPIAGLAARHEILEDFGRKVRYFNTFGGNPVCIAAAEAVLDVIEDEGLQANAQATGAYLKASMEDLAAGSAVLSAPGAGAGGAGTGGAGAGGAGAGGAGVRGAGLYLGVDVIDPATGEPSASIASRIVNRLRDRRVLISSTGPAGNTLKIRPPLPFGPAHADEFTAALAEVLTASPQTA